nr:MAG TPA: hypothetical protein [Caudoviricetes sp.]
MSPSWLPTSLGVDSLPRCTRGSVCHLLLLSSIVARARYGRWSRSLPCTTTTPPTCIDEQPPAYFDG